MFSFTLLQLWKAKKASKKKYGKMLKNRVTIMPCLDFTVTTKTTIPNNYGLTIARKNLWNTWIVSQSNKWLYNISVESFSSFRHGYLHYTHWVHGSCKTFDLSTIVCFIQIIACLTEYIQVVFLWLMYAKKTHTIGQDKNANARTELCKIGCSVDYWRCFNHILRLADKFIVIVIFSKVSLILI